MLRGVPTLSETLGFAILGTGSIANVHRQAIAANAALGARLVAVGHHDPARFGDIGAAFGVPCLGQEALLARADVDVVCLATPSGQHAAQAIAAARAGKHVLTEKPMALSLADADAMIEACEQAGVQLGVLLQRRAEPVFRRTYDAIRAGDLGQLTLVVITMPYFRPQAYYDQAAWRGTWELDGGGALMNQGIHILDLLLWFVGADPSRIQARAATLQRDIAVEDTVVASLEFPGGALGTLAATTTAAPGFRHRIELYGTGGAIQLEGESVVRWDLVEPSKASVEPPSGGSGSDRSGSDPRGISPEAHTALVRDFVEALRSGRPPFVDGREARRSLATVLGVYAAAGLPSAPSRS